LSIAGASRYAVSHAVVPNSLAKHQAFVDAVAAKAREVQAKLVLPISDESMLALLPAASRIMPAKIPFAQIDVFRTAADKAHVLNLASTLGMATPEQLRLDSPAAASSFDYEAVPLPIVVKPARSVAGTGAGAIKLGVRYAQTPRELEGIVREMPEGAFPLLLQRRIRGAGTGVFLLVWGGKTVARFAHRRIREKPPSGGVSVCAESVEADSTTVAQAEALLAALNWCGPAMVEFKEDAQSGVRYLMEINGRFWGSLQLAIDAGVDFPALLVGAALGRPLSPPPHYTVGLRERWWWGEVDHLIARLRSERNDTALPSLGKAVWDFLVNRSRAQNEVFRRDDPWPAIVESVAWVRGR